jgi:hypothetical protein
MTFGGPKGGRHRKASVFKPDPARKPPSVKKQANGELRVHTGRAQGGLTNSIFVA